MSTPAPEAMTLGLGPLKEVPEHILNLLSQLHSKSKEQESRITQADFEGRSFDNVMQDKFIALDEDKALFVYQLCRALGATTVVEAGTSYGVSTIYLALAVAANVKTLAAGGNATEHGKLGRVVATEYEPAKAAKAREHWAQCGDAVTSVIDLREGDLLETLQGNLQNVDFLLLDIWAKMALPTLKLVQPKLRRGAVVIADNTTAAADKYADFLNYIRGPGSPFITATLPFTGGLEMSVYLPTSE